MNELDLKKTSIQLGVQRTIDMLIKTLTKVFLRAFFSMFLLLPLSVVDTAAAVTVVRRETAPVPWGAAMEFTVRITFSRVTIICRVTLAATQVVSPLPLRTYWTKGSFSQHVRSHTFAKIYSPFRLMYHKWFL